MYKSHVLIYTCIAVDVNVADAVVDDKVEVERYDDDKDEDDVTNSPSTEETPHVRLTCSLNLLNLLNQCLYPLL